MVSEAGYRAARTRAASLDRPGRGHIIVAGADRASFLQGLLTNDIAALAPGAGCYAAYLTPQGRMISDLFVYALDGEMLIAVPRHVKDSLLARFDRLIFTEDVTIRDATDSLREIAIVGPDASKVIGKLFEDVAIDPIDALPEHGNMSVDVAGTRAVIARITDTGEPGFALYLDRAQAAGIESGLDRAGVVPLDPETADALRIEAGVPLFGRDMDEETIPLEAGIEERAISFTKGCYVGQEVIVRVLHRGHGRVARKLVGLEIEGDRVPPPRSVVTAAGRDAGHVTSATMSPALNRPIALAYLHRDFIAPATEVLVAGSRAVVAGLPFARK